MDSKDQLLSGAAWRTGTDIIGKVLGVVYIIPWFMWMGKFGNQANALYSMGYSVYTIFLLLSTIGIPGAIAREVAYYNALGDENLAYRVVREMTLILIGLGALMGAIMAIFAPFFANMLGGGTALIPVVRSLALAVFAAPAMGAIRGYFQGMNLIKAIALSNLCEQVVRVFWMLVTAYTIMVMGSHNWETAVVQSTTAAFVGMIGSYALLLFYLVKTKSLMRIINPGPATMKIHPLRLIDHTMRIAVPFIVIGSATQIFQLIDQSSFMAIMSHVTTYSHNELLDLVAYFSANVNKLTMILLGVALTIGNVSDPLITEANTKGDRKGLAVLVVYNFRLFIGFMLPAVIGMSLLTIPLYTLFYEHPSSLQSSLFVFAVLQSFLLGLYLIIFPTLSIMNYKKTSMKFFGWTLLVKLIVQAPAILLFHSYGPLVSTTLAFGFGVWLFIRKLYKITLFSKKNVMKTFYGVALITAVMGISVILVELLLGILFGSHPSRTESAIIVLLGGVVGFYVYLFISAKLGMLEKILGERANSLRRKLRI